MNSAIVPTKVLTDPTELERIMQSGLQAATGIPQQDGANGYSFEGGQPAIFGAGDNYQVRLYSIH